MDGAHDDRRGQNHVVVRQLHPHDILNMAAYYHVDLAKSPFLLPIVTQAVQTPLPPNWVEGKDEVSNGAIYINEITQETQKEHPADSYFVSLIQATRDKQHSTDSSPSSDSAWMEFYEDDHPYYYNFITNKRQDTMPSCGFIFTPGEHDTMLKDVFSQAAELHRLPKINSLEKLDILCFHSSWNETRLNVLEKRHADIYFSIRAKHFQFVLGNCDNVYTISHINGRDEKPLEAWDLYVGAKITILGRSTTLMKASMLTLQWLDFQTKKLMAIKEKLHNELKKYDLHHVQAKYKGKIESPEIRLSLNGVSLRQLENEIEHLRERLSTYRPDLARKIVYSLFE
ncbi:hypothetical protein AeRB84_011883 [Aphanomyces euteiches]|nr:hypothetical protein AeRB84_011883 [Aphanomyces euteiches]